ncbi:hypothetical protein HJD18_14525 [Thermoleophilia bacterium SCSIO 60948]|nr:hypothetical protein HJD18_14525 [Thermoleophilia bacterium SCSIO 60948]
MRFAGRKQPVIEQAEGAPETVPEPGVAEALRSGTDRGLDSMIDLGIGEVARVAVAAETAAQAIRRQLTEERRAAEADLEDWEPRRLDSELERAERIGGSLVAKLRGIEDHCHRLLDRLEQLERDRGADAPAEDPRVIARRMAAEGSSREEIERFLRELDAAPVTATDTTESEALPLRHTA